MQPTALNTRLPIGSRRSATGACAVVITASSPLPRLAPSTSPSATLVGRMPEAASAAVSSTLARLEYDSTASRVPTRMSSITSLGSATNSARTAGDSVSGRVLPAMSCNDSRISPRPIATWPSRPALLLARVMYITTPTKISKGDSHDRSNENANAISPVPMSAPSIAASAADSGTRLRPRNDDTIRQVAVLDCSRLVTPKPAATAVGRAPMLTASRWRRFSPTR